MLVLLYIFLASFCKWHTILVCSIYGIEETTSVEKTSIILFGIKDKNWVVKTLYSVFIIVRKITMSWIPLMILVPLFGRLFSWQDLTLSQLSTGLFPWLEFNLSHAFINLHVCLKFNSCSVYHQLVLSYKCYVCWCFGYYKRFLLARINLINPCFYVLPSGRYLQMFCIH